MAPFLYRLQRFEAGTQGMASFYIIYISFWQRNVELHRIALRLITGTKPMSKNSLLCWRKSSIRSMTSRNLRLLFAKFPTNSIYILINPYRLRNCPVESVRPKKMSNGSWQRIFQPAVHSSKNTHPLPLTLNLSNMTRMDKMAARMTTQTTRMVDIRKTKALTHWKIGSMVWRRK